jgi:hypothetical protein
VGKNNNIIEINGIRYDARTGAAISNSASSPRKPATGPIKPAVKRPTMNDVVRHPAKHSPAHSQKPSETLMRRSVKKPATTPRKHSKATGHVDVLAIKPPSQLLTKKSVSRLNDKRVVKARKIPQSKLIQHFSPVTSDSNKFATIAPIPTTPAPLTPRPLAAPVKLVAKPKTTAELLDHALRHATSHEQKAPTKRKSRRGLKIAGTAALLFLLVGVVVSQQLPSMRLHMASAKAGFHASLPDYKPAGYSMTKLDSNSGVVATTFDSNSDQRAYTITQKTSNWDSQALRDNFVVGHDKNYKTASEAGRTIYMYGDHDATWVNAGIWYIVQSNGSLTTQQLLDLASSL